MDELIAKRYGTALFNLAVEKNEVDALFSQVQMVKETIESNPEILNILEHPQVNEAQRILLVEKVYTNQVSDGIIGLILLTIKKNRQSHLVAIFDCFLDLVYEHKNIVFAHVTSHKAMTQNQREQMMAKMQELTNKEIHLVEYVDVQLIGGISIRLGDRVIDYSIKGLIGDMKKQLLKNA